MKDELINDRDLERVIEVLEKEKLDSDKKLTEYDKQSELSSEYNERAKMFKEENKDVTMDVAIDPMTGLSLPTIPKTEDYNISDIKLSQLAENRNLDVDGITIKNIFNTVYDKTDLEDRDIKEIIDFIRMVEIDKPKNIYNLLPDIVKNLIRDTIQSPTPQEKEFAAKTFLDMIRSEIVLDKTFIELEETIKKELEIPDFTSLYLDNLQEMMEKEVLITADNIQESAPEKAELLRNISKAFVDSYTFTIVKNKINNKKNIINKELTRELNNYDKYCKKFNARYKHSKFVITDMRKLLYILDRKLPKDDIHIDSIKKFIILLCKIFRKMSPDDLIDHTIMYYTTKMIEALDYTDSDETKVSNILINNITEVIHMIES